MVYLDKKTGKVYDEEGKQLKSPSGEDVWNDIKKFGTKIFEGLTGETSAKATLQANQTNIANQNYWNQIAMQREDTAHQREVADLQAAGLNPWLSMGNGAQSTAMNTAQVDPVDGSKVLSATTGMALLGLIRLLSGHRKTSNNTTINKYFIRK